LQNLLSTTKAQGSAEQIDVGHITENARQSANSADDDEIPSTDISDTPVTVASEVGFVTAAISDTTDTTVAARSEAIPYGVPPHSRPDIMGHTAEDMSDAQEPELLKGKLPIQIQIGSLL